MQQKTQTPRTVPERDTDPAKRLSTDAPVARPYGGTTRRTPEVDEGKELAASRKAGAGSIFAGPLVRAAIRESVRKLDPRVVAKNPVMFVVEVGAAITTIVLLQQLVIRSGDRLLPLADGREHRPYMVLEYVEGESLRSYLHAHGPLPIDDVLRSGAELACSAVAEEIATMGTWPLDRTWWFRSNPAELGRSRSSTSRSGWMRS